MALILKFAMDDTLQLEASSSLQTGHLWSCRLVGGSEIESSQLEHGIGDLRAYRSDPGQSVRFRNRWYFLPVVVKVVIAFVNRRRRLIRTTKRDFMDLLLT